MGASALLTSGQNPSDSNALCGNTGPLDLVNHKHRNFVVDCRQQLFGRFITVHKKADGSAFAVAEIYVQQTTDVDEGSDLAGTYYKCEKHRNMFYIYK